MTSSLRNPLLRILPFVKHLTKSNQQNHSSEKLAVAKPVSFYELSSQLQMGQLLPFASFKGKQVLLVNGASHAADASQYHELQQLAEQFADELVVLVFPAADFAAAGKAPLPSPSTTKPILLMEPSIVVKTTQQHPVYKWLSTANQNGWNEQAPPHNFTKYLVNATGQLAHYFGPTLSPLSETIIERIKNPAV